jgi:uncharacterized membrane protein YphA (DoxX/SURF4 family)
MLESPVTEKTSVQPVWVTFLRIALGFILVWKGYVFMRNTSSLQSMIEQTGVGVFSQNSEVLAFIVCYITLLCGLFIACGLFTKTCSYVQIPILIVAIFFVNIRNIGTSGWEFLLSLVTLLLLILFAIKGSGTLSADEFFRSYYKAGTEEGQTKRFFESK